MNTWSAFKVAYRALESNKVRSVLTTLGIIIGVAAVITLIAVTQGAEKMIQDQLASLGGKSFMVKTGKRGVGAQENGTALTAQDAEAIRGLDMISYASPLVDSSEQVVWGKRAWFTVILGTSPDFVNINDWYPGEGNFFNYQDLKESERVCVLGSTVASNLFGSQNPLGKTVRISKSYFRVIGVMTPLGQTSSGRDQDDIILIPYTTFQKNIKRIDKVESISVSVGDAEDMDIAQTRVITLIKQRHNLGPGEGSDIYIRSQQGIIDRIFTISRIMTILLASVASISLIVGGIGIMNIMLVSVRERTREIGIRMAVGAKERDILVQFLIESILLSLTGGLIGILVGILGSVVASISTEWPAVISPGAILLAFSFAAVIGIFFGIYPARKASKLDPIEALRYE